LGLVAFIVSTVLGIPAVAASGFGAILIGLLLAYVSFLPTVPPELLGEALAPTMENLEALLRKLGVNAYARYIWSGCDLTLFRVFVPLSEDAAAPSESKITDEIVVIPAENIGENGLLLNPPGTGLLAMLERESGQDIADVDLSGLEDALSIGIVKSLELGSSVRLSFENSRVQFLLEGDLLWEFSKKLAEDAPILCERIGCPICSLVACALAKSSHRNVKFQGAKHLDRRHRASFELLE